MTTDLGLGSERPRTSLEEKTGRGPISWPSPRKLKRAHGSKERGESPLEKRQAAMSVRHVARNTVEPDLATQRESAPDGKETKRQTSYGEKKEKPEYINNVYAGREGPSRLSDQGSDSKSKIRG